MKNIHIKAAVIFIIAAVSFMLSGFTGANKTEIDDSGFTDLMQQRTVTMQRFIFSCEKDEQELFSRLSEIETYPALSDDFRSASSCISDDCDRVINMKIEEVECKIHTRSYGIYYADIRWYMSGYNGYYNESVSYRVRTHIVNGRQYIADITCR